MSSKKRIGFDGKKTHMQANVKKRKRKKKKEKEKKRKIFLFYLLTTQLK